MAFADLASCKTTHFSLNIGKLKKYLSHNYTQEKESLC